MPSIFKCIGPLCAQFSNSLRNLIRMYVKDILSKEKITEL